MLNKCVWDVEDDTAVVDSPPRTAISTRILSSIYPGFGGFTQLILHLLSRCVKNGGKWRKDKLLRRIKTLYKTNPHELNIP
jgi:hypothetical protein